jgi:hypothetical protein
MSIVHRSLLLTLGLLACQPERGQGPDPALDQAVPGPIVTAHALTVPHPWVGKVVQLMTWAPAPNDLQVCVDTPGNDAVSGKDLQLDRCNPVAKQLFRIIRITPSSSQPRADLVAFQSMTNGSLCLDFEGGTTNGGERLQLFPCHNGANQSFALPWPKQYGPLSYYIYSGVSTDGLGHPVYRTRLDKGPRAWWIPMQVKNLGPLGDTPEGQFATRWYLLENGLALQGSWSP